MAVDDMNAARFGGGSEDRKKAVLEGELVPVGVTGGQGRYREQTGQYNTTVDPDMVEEIIRERLIYRKTYRQIADLYPVSITTIRRWCNEGPQSIAARDVNERRARLALEFDELAKQGWRLHQEARALGDRKGQLDALARLESIVRGTAILVGANAPAQVKADVTVTEQSEADRALIEMVNEAKAKAEAEKARVEAEFRGLT